MGRPWERKEEGREVKNIIVDKVRNEVGIRR